MVRTQCFHYRGLGSIPRRGNEIPASDAAWPKKKKKKRKKAGNKGVFKGRFLALNVLENESEIKHTTQ